MSAEVEILIKTKKIMINVASPTSACSCRDTAEFMGVTWLASFS